MGLLDRFERRLNRLVDGTFARAFPSDIQPVEIASALQREMDRHAAILRRDQTMVPAHYQVWLGSHDFQRLSPYLASLASEFATMLNSYAQENRYLHEEAIVVELQQDPALKTGVFHTASTSGQPEPVQHSSPLSRYRAGEAAPIAAAPPATPAPMRPDTPYLIGPAGTFPLSQPVLRIGRGSDVEIRLDDPGVSRHHAQIVLGKEVMLRDLASTNGTYVNGQPTREAVLQDGQVLRFGDTELTYWSNPDV